MANDTATVTQTVNTITVDDSSQNTVTVSSDSGGSVTISDSTPSLATVSISPVSSTLTLESEFSPKESSDEVDHLLAFIQHDASRGISKKSVTDSTEE